MSHNSQGGLSILEIQKSKLFEKTSRTPENMPFPSGLSVDTTYDLKGQAAIRLFAKLRRQAMGNYFRWSGGVKATCYAGDFNKLACYQNA